MYLTKDSINTWNILYVNLFFVSLKSIRKKKMFIPQEQKFKRILGSSQPKKAWDSLVPVVKYNVLVFCGFSLYIYIIIYTCVCVLKVKPWFSCFSTRFTPLKIFLLYLLSLTFNIIYVYFWDTEGWIFYYGVSWAIYLFRIINYSNLHSRLFFYNL